jgi:penicillin-binding protein 1A
MGKRDAVATLKPDVAVGTERTRTGATNGRKHASHKKRPQLKGFKGWLKRWWWVFVVAPAGAVLLVLLTLIWIYSRLELPKTPPPLQTTYIYDRHGNQIATLHASVDRTIIPLSEMPKHLRNAVIAVEDGGFYDHPGFDPVGIVRAAWTDLVRREVVQGASTITQQLVKNVYAGEYVEDPETGESEYVVPPRNVEQKIREVLLAVKVEQQFSKDEILAKYLNTVYFGRGAYGAQAAAQTYWQKDARDLTILESATLAGLITKPSLYDPVDQPETALERRNYALSRMVVDGYLSEERAQAMMDKDIKVNPIDLGLNFSGKLGYFLDHTRKTLLDRYDDNEDIVFGGGLQVRTTLDMQMQNAAEAAVAKYLNDENTPDAAVVAIDTHTGGILAMYGGKNFNREHTNLATGQGGTGRQAGSAFKPFTLLAALEQGYPLTSGWNGPSSITIQDPRCYTDGEPWQVSNAGDSTSGYFTLLSATTNSVNTVYAQIAPAVGPEAVVDVAHRMGIRSELQPVCSIAIGTQEVNPLEMASAYATLASRGEYHRPTPLLRVENPSGETTSIRQNGTRVLDRNDADLATSALQTVIASGTGTNAIIPWPAAGKTGTNQEFRDAWFCGYTVQIATCVWVGYAEAQIELYNVEGYSVVYGGTLPALIWHDFMLSAMEGMRVREFATPTTEGYTQTPPTPVSSPQPSPTVTETPEPEPEPTKDPKPEPTQEPQPTQTPAPTGPTGPSGATGALPSPTP